MEIGDEAAKGEGIDNLTVRCLGGQALPLDPGRRVLSPVTRWAQPVGESETLRTLSRTEMNLFGRSISNNGLRPEDGSRCPSGNRGGGEFKKDTETQSVDARELVRTRALVFSQERVFYTRTWNRTGGLWERCTARYFRYRRRDEPIQVNTSKYSILSFRYK